MLGNEAAAEKSAGPKGELFNLKQNTDWNLRVLVTFKPLLDIEVQIKKFMRNAG